MTPPGDHADPAVPAGERVIPTDPERAAVVARIIAAADDGALELDEAGHLASLAYRATRRGDLDRIGRRLDVAGEAVRSVSLRRRQWRSLGWLAVCALVSALVIVGLFYGLGPIDPH